MRSIHFSVPSVCPRPLPLPHKTVPQLASMQTQEWANKMNVCTHRNYTWQMKVYGRSFGGWGAILTQSRVVLESGSVVPHIVEVLNVTVHPLFCTWANTAFLNGQRQ